MATEQTKPYVVLDDGNVIIFNPMKHEFNDEEYVIKDDAGNPHKHPMDYGSISKDAQGVIEYKRIREDLARILGQQAYTMMTLTATLPTKRESAETIYIMCPKPEDIADDVAAIDTKMRIEIIQGRVGFC